MARFRRFRERQLGAYLKMLLRLMKVRTGLSRTNRRCCQEGGRHDVIEGLPKGYDTVLGRTFDEGVDLFGGEWQHLAISRAFMSDAQIIVLDEPTAALDAFREHQLYEQVAELAAEKTVVFISHRFSTVRMADLIVVLDHGKVIEVGDHEALIAKDGKYAAMFNTQAARYR